MSGSFGNADLLKYRRDFRFDSFVVALFWSLADVQATVEGPHVAPWQGHDPSRRDRTAPSLAKAGRRLLVESSDQRYWAGLAPTKVLRDVLNRVLRSAQVAQCSGEGACSLVESCRTQACNLTLIAEHFEQCVLLYFWPLGKVCGHRSRIPVTPRYPAERRIVSGRPASFFFFTGT